MDDFFELRGNVWVQSNEGNRSTVQDGVKDHPLTLSAERQRPGRHLVQHCTEGEQVSASIEFLGSHLLWRHVGDRPQHCPRTCQMFLKVEGRGARGRAFRLENDLGQPEIKNLRLTSVGDKDVGWLDVTMDNPFRMCRIESIGDLNTEIKHRLYLQPLTNNAVPEGLSL